MSVFLSDLSFSLSLSLSSLSLPSLSGVCGSYPWGRDHTTNQYRVCEKGHPNCFWHAAKTILLPFSFTLCTLMYSRSWLIGGVWVAFSLSSLPSLSLSPLSLSQIHIMAPIVHSLTTSPHGGSRHQRRGLSILSRLFATFSKGSEKYGNEKQKSSLVCDNSLSLSFSLSLSLSLSLSPKARNLFAKCFLTRGWRGERRGKV